MSHEIKLEGIMELDKKLAKNIQKQAVRTIVKKNGAALQKKAQKKAPIGTPESTGIPDYKGGTLRRSIGLEIGNDGLTATVEPTAEYAAYVEYGTRFMKAQPYLGPAFDEQSKIFKSDMEKLVR